MRIHLYDEAEVVHLVLDDRPVPEFSEFPHPLVTADYVGSRLIGVEAVGSMRPALIRALADSLEAGEGVEALSARLAVLGK